MLATSAAGLRHRHHGRHLEASSSRALLRDESIRHLDKNDSTMKSLSLFLGNRERLHSLEAYFFSLELEPPNVRAERIISLFDTMTVFGALYFSVIFSVMEFGSKAPTNNVIADRLFHFSNALGLIATSFMSMFSSFLWIASILFSNSNINWVSSTRPMLSLNIVFVSTILVTTIVSTGIAMYGQFAALALERTLLLGFLVGVVVRSMHKLSNIFVKEIPLEFVNLPRFYRLVFFPFPWLTERSRRELHQNAQGRANDLSKRQIQLTEGVGDMMQKKPFSDVTSLLTFAVKQIDRSNVDVTPFVQKLEKEWFDNVDSLRGLSPEQLAKLMPLRLAMEVCKLLEKEEAEE